MALYHTLYLQRRNSSYYYRRAIPDDLRHHFNNKKEIIKSLRTGDKVQAILHQNYVTMQVELIFSELRGNQMGFDLSKFNMNKASKLEVSGYKKDVDGNVEIQGLKVDPNHVEAEKELLAAIGLNLGGEPVATKPKAKKKGMRFSELADKYIHFAQLSVKSEAQDKAIFQLFIELYGDPYIHDIDHPMMTNFVDIIQNNIPANAKKTYPTLTAKQISKLNHTGKRMMSAHSINKYLGRVGLVFKYGVNHGFMETNYAEGKRVKDQGKAKDKRRVFTLAELSTMFNQTKIYSTPYTGTMKQDIFWACLIACFSGMRLGEICQLEPSDIRKENDIWVFDINDNRALKSCKTSGSKRLVPIHSELLALGIIEFVKGRQSQSWLFKWDYNPMQGWSYRSSKDINNFIKSTAGIKEQSIHCFRHSVADVLMKNRSVSKDVQEEILGHAHEGQSYGRYGKGFSIEEIKDGIEAIKYDGLDLSHLYV